MKQVHKRFKDIIIHLDESVRILKKQIEDLDYWDESGVGVKVIEKLNSIFKRLCILSRFLDDETQTIKFPN